MRIFQRLMRELEASRHPEALRDALAQAVSDLDVPGRFAYLGFRSANQPILVATYPREWTDHYFARRYDGIDPVVQAATHSYLPFYWGDGAQPTSVQQETLFQEAASFGISHGFTIPLHDSNGRAATLNFSCDTEVDEFRAAITQHHHLIHLVGIYFHAHVRRKIPHILGGNHPNLSPREIECLAWAAKGKSYPDMALILDIAPRTVKFHLGNALRKLGVTTTRQAIARAVVHGLIDP